MGSSIQLPEKDHKMLAQRIEEIIYGTPSFVPYPKEVERLAQMYASQVIRNLSAAAANPTESSIAISPIGKDTIAKSTLDEEHFVTIDVNTVEQSEPRTVGTEHLLLKMSDQIGLTKKLKELKLSDTEIALSLGTIVARATRPRSERATYSWLCKSSGLSELLDFDFNKSSLNRLYKISDKLLNHKNDIERHLEITEQQFHGYRSTIALYDLTNTYMEGQAKSNSKATYGVSKEKRSDCPLITMGLVMNEHGFLNRTSMLPGNASEPKTLQAMISKLDTHASLFKPIIVLDAGISSEDNLQWLKENKYPYIVSARQDAPSMEIEGELVPVGDLKNFVKAALVKGSTEGEEKWLYCESEAKAVTATQMKESFKKQFEENLQKLVNGLTKSKGRKKYTKILERIGRLKEKHKRISGCYDIKVTPTEDGMHASAIEWKIIEEKMSEKLTGSYFLRTNLTQNDPKELWQLYNSLRGVEDAFRFMKSSLGFRPVYHQKERRVDGHLWITVLAYHLIQNCLYQLGKQGINNHWESIRSIVGTRVRVTTQAKTKEGKTLYHRSSTKAEGEQIAIYKALNLSPQILKAQKIIL